MRPQSVQQSLLLLLVMLLAACKSSYEIAEPLKDSLHTSPPAVFKVTYDKKPAALPKFAINGFDVAAQFTAGDTEATAPGSALQSYLKEGVNSFQVSPPLGPMVKFTYDTKGPAIIVLSAEVAGATTTIHGLADDEMGVNSATVNGAPITVAADGTFTVAVPTSDVYTYVATDSLGHTSTTRYAALGKEYDPSLTVRVTEQGLNFAMVQIVNALNGADLNSLVAGSMLYDDTWSGLFGETYGADGFVRRLSISASDFGMDLQNGNNASFNGTITNAHVELTLRLHNGFLPPTVINVGAQVGPLTLGGTMNLGVNNQMPTINMTAFNFHVGAVVIDNVNVVFQAIISGVTTGIVNLFNGPISNAIRGAVNEAIPEMLAGIIQDSYTIRIHDGVSDFDMAMAIKLANITTTNDSLYAALAGSVIPANPNNAIPQPLAGSLYTPVALPPASLNGGQFAVSINTNLINQTLASAHSVGLTQMNMVGNGVQFGLPRTDDFGPAEATHRILVNNVTPAALRISNINGTAATQLTVYGLEMHGESKKNGQPYFTNDLSVRVNARVVVTIDVSDDGKLDVIFPAVPEVEVTGIRIGTGAWTGNVINSLADELVREAIGGILEELAKPVESIELPSFACMAFNVNGITAVGSGEGHLNVAGTLVKISNECDNEVTPPPKVAYGRGVGVPMSCSSSQEYDAGLCYQQCNEGYNGVGPVCWKEDASYGRGVGTIPTQCAPGHELDAGLCYPVCSSGYNGVGPVCWSTRPLSYGRGVGTIPSNIWTGECPSGKENDAGLCYYYCDAGYNGVGPVCWLENASYGRGVGTIPKNCGSGKEYDAGLCYPVCQSGYHGVGPVCWTNQALSYGRGVGVPVHTCQSGWEKNGLLCYPKCDAGYNGVGPVCWPSN